MILGAILGAIGGSMIPVVGTGLGAVGGAFTGWVLGIAAAAATKPAAAPAESAPK